MDRAQIKFCDASALSLLFGARTRPRVQWLAPSPTTGQGLDGRGRRSKHARRVCSPEQTIGPLPRRPAICFSRLEYLDGGALPCANRVLTMIPNSQVGTARRAVRSRLGEATLPKADVRPTDVFSETLNTAGVNPEQHKNCPLCGLPALPKTLNFRLGTLN